MATEESQVEVIAIEVIPAGGLLIEPIDVNREDLFLVLENRHIFRSDAVSFALDALVERQVGHVCFEGIDLNLSIIHLLFDCLLLALQVSLSPAGHAHLSELVNDFEEDKEGDHSS